MNAIKVELSEDSRVRCRTRITGSCGEQSVHIVQWLC